LKIGVLSDTHDHIDNVKRAVEIFKSEGVQLILHAGDYVAPFSLTPLKEAGCRVIGVFGNNDGERLMLSRRFQEIGEIYDGPYFFTMEGRRILLMHEPCAAEELFASGCFDLIVFGHTHRRVLKKERGILLNPGECCGWLEKEPSIATVDLETWDVKEIRL
jgi:putative phosphoesterase